MDKENYEMVESYRDEAIERKRKKNIRTIKKALLKESQCYSKDGGWTVEQLAEIKAIYNITRKQIKELKQGGCDD